MHWTICRFLLWIHTKIIGRRMSIYRIDNPLWISAHSSNSSTVEEKKQQFRHTIRSTDKCICFQTCHVYFHWLQPVFSLSLSLQWLLSFVQASSRWRLVNWQFVWYLAWLTHTFCPIRNLFMRSAHWFVNHHDSIPYWKKPSEWKLLKNNPSLGIH